MRHQQLLRILTTTATATSISSASLYKTTPPYAQFASVAAAAGEWGVGVISNKMRFTRSYAMLEGWRKISVFAIDLHISLLEKKRCSLIRYDMKMNFSQIAKTDISNLRHPSNNAYDRVRLSETAFYYWSPGSEWGRVNASWLCYFSGRGRRQWH